jgi:hypothetical protein
VLPVSTILSNCIEAVAHAFTHGRRGAPQVDAEPGVVTAVPALRAGRSHRARTGNRTIGHHGRRENQPSGSSRA